MTSIFSGLITSKTRIRILMRIFLNPERNVYLRELADEFQASPSHIKNELDQLKEADLVTSRKNGRQVLFSANKKHPVFNELHSMVKKALGMDRILDSMIDRLGNLEKAILVDDYAEGKDTGIIDLVLVGDIDQHNLQDLTRKTERYIERKIRTLVLTNEEYKTLAPNLSKRPNFILWQWEENFTLPGTDSDRQHKDRQPVCTEQMNEKYSNVEI
jgi:DNA-binding transcriptional ArsR family regulator